MVTGIEYHIQGRLTVFLFVSLVIVSCDLVLVCNLYLVSWLLRQTSNVKRLTQLVSWLFVKRLTSNVLRQT